MILASFSEFARQFGAIFPVLAPRYGLAWGFSFILLLATFSWLRPHLRDSMQHVDLHWRNWALALRFRQMDEKDGDRIARTWFFRFWTNFASAPSLGFMSLALAVWAHATDQPQPTLFYLPGLAFIGSMAMSYISKRIYRRPRPQRDEGDFGHRLRDGSFPSGHSLTAFAFWLSLVMVASIAGILGSLAIVCLLAAIAIVALTGLSRVYLGVHFPSDVIGGFIIGGVWVAACYFMVRPIL